MYCIRIEAAISASLFWAVMGLDSLSENSEAALA
jgi:hypothetical protein